MLLEHIDRHWREHLDEMDYLREGIHLRGMAQKDPLVEYRVEGHSMFEELMSSIWEEFARYIFHVEVEIEGDNGQAQQQAGWAAAGNTSATGAFNYAGGTAADQPSALAAAAAGAGAAGAAVGEDGEPASLMPPVVETRHVDERDQIGRNDPCWCGSGKKFKKCHGA